MTAKTVDDAAQSLPLSMEAIGPTSARDSGRRMARAQGEHFPVASRLLPRPSRAPVLALYAFARGADDLADDPTRSPAERLAALEALTALLQAIPAPVPPTAAPGWAHPFLHMAAHHPQAALLQQAGLDLLTAFRADAADATPTGYAAWSDMLQYCQYSAVPIGRAFLAVTEPEVLTIPPARTATDRLCEAMQILNHVRDVGTDYRAFGRIYLPRQWIQEAGAQPKDLHRPRSTPAWRAVLDRTLAATAPLLQEAAHLPGYVCTPGLRRELRLLLGLATAMHRRLRHRDPLAGRIGPGTSGCVRALWSVLAARNPAMPSTARRDI